MKQFCDRGECEKRDLQAEIERLRAALKEVTDHAWYQGDFAREVARKALEQ